MTQRPLGNGIDFGTSNSAVAIAYADRVELVPIGRSRTLPSFVYAGGITGPVTLLG